MKHLLHRLIIAGLLCGAPLIAEANLPLTGSFQAEKQCPALHSIKKNTNPGQLFLKPGQTYPLHAKNKPDATHYLVQIQGKKRWVSRQCGKLSARSVDNTRPINASQDYLLAVSWQPAFCQTHQNKKECKTQTSRSFEATHLALHGLWPQPRNNAYCNVSTTHKAIDRRGAWHLLPALHISAPVRKALNKVMPGTASDLQRHEWYKHGSCYGSPEVYYRDSLALMQQLNDSGVRRVFADNIGKKITATQIRQAFDQSFGQGTGRKVNVRCSGRLIGEIWVNLRGKITPQTPLKTLLAKAPVVARPACDGGLVDPAGF